MHYWIKKVEEPSIIFVHNVHLFINDNLSSWVTNIFVLQLRVYGCPTTFTALLSWPQGNSSSLFPPGKWINFYTIFKDYNSLSVITKYWLYGDFPVGPVAKTSPSNAVSVDPWSRIKIPHASQPKHQTIEQKQYCNTLKTLKMVHVRKNIGYFPTLYNISL